MKYLNLLLKVLFGLVVFAWIGIAFRSLPVVFVLVSILIAIFPKFKMKEVTVWILLGLAMVVPFQPYDISLKTWSGPPKLVPFITGLPRNRDFMLEKQKRGDLVLGGDIVSGFEPKWVVIW